MRAALLVLLTAALLHSQVTRIPGGSGGGGGGGGGVQEVGAGGGITVTNPTGPTATVAVDTAVVPTKGAEHTIAERWLFSKGLAITPGSDPASPEAGRVTINTSHLLRVWTGTVWRTALYDPGSNGLLRRTTEGLTGAVAVCQSGQYLTGDGVDPSCAQVNASQVTNAFDKSTSNTILDGTQDFTSAAATRPFRRLAFASFPSTCQAGTDMLVRSNPATAGQVLYICNSSGNGWDLVGDGGGGGGGYSTVQDEGTGLTQRSTLNFVGQGVTCSDDSANGRTNCSVPSTALYDSNGVTAVTTTAGSSPVNFITVLNAATGARPGIQAAGSDTNVDLNIIPKGGTSRYVNVAGRLSFKGATDSMDSNQLYIDQCLTHRLCFHNVNTRILVLSNNTGGGVIMDSARRLGWGTDLNNPETSFDTGFRRAAAGEIEINNGTTGSYRDLLLRSPRLDPAGSSRPTCSSTNRGRVWVEYGASGVKDTVGVCRKGSDDTYSWSDVDGEIALNRLAAVARRRQMEIRIGDENTPGAQALVDTEDVMGAWRNLFGATLRIVEIGCQSDAGTPTINVQRNDGSPANILSSALSCSTSYACSRVSGDTTSLDGSTTCSGTLSTTERDFSPGHELDALIVSAGGTAKRVVIRVVGELQP